VCCDPFFGDAVHFFGSDLNLELGVHTSPITVV